jgi:hypothetical protein
MGAVMFGDFECAPVVFLQLFKYCERAQKSGAKIHRFIVSSLLESKLEQIGLAS